MHNSFYYTDSKKIFLNKIDAIKHFEKTGEKIFFYYYDDVFSKLDWTNEPPCVVEFYYREQARRIRDEFDYVVLFYSGGYDSTNILETFYYNNIKLDKIVCVGAFSQDDNSCSDINHNGELYANSFPYLDKLNLSSITQICDYTKYFNSVKNFSVYDFGSQWIENVGPWFSPHNWFWRDIHHFVIPEHMKDKKVALIWGKDKPKLIEVDNKLYFNFYDAPALSYAGEVKYNNVKRINFYWDPDFPLIPIKQAHVLAKNKTLFNDNVFYNLRNPPIFKSKKSPSTLFSLRDAYLVEKKDSEIFDFYSTGMNRIFKEINPKNLISLNTRPYFVCEKN